MQPSSLAKHGTLPLFLVLIVFYFYGFGDFPLLGPDEPRYTQVAREMFQRGDLITPTLGGYHWFEKPVLLYWLMIGSFKVFGISEWAARFGSAICGLLTVLAVFWAARCSEKRLPDRYAEGFSFWSAFVAGTSIGLIAFSRAASFDIVVTMTTAWSLAFFLVAELEPDLKRRRLLLAGFYAAIGLSLLAKGLVGLVVPFGVVVVYFLLRGRGPDRVLFKSLLWGLPLALGVAAIWYGPIIWRHGSPFINRFILDHHLARYVSDKYRHPAPIYFYLLVLPALVLPWTIFLIESLWKARKLLWRSNDLSSTVSLLAFAWLILPVVFFSFSGSKLPGYILPALPAAALIVGHRLTNFTLDRGASSWSLRATGVLLVLAALAGLIYAQRSREVSTQCALSILAPLFIAGVISLVFTSRKTLPLISIAAAVLVSLAVAQRCAASKYVERESSKTLIELARQRGYSETPIYGMQRDDRSPEFYAAGKVVYGDDGEPILYEGLGPVLVESKRRNQPLLVFIPKHDLVYLDKLRPARIEVIGDNGRNALIALQAP